MISTLLLVLASLSQPAESPAITEFTWSAATDGVAIGLRQVEGRMASEVVLELAIENRSDAPRTIPVETCASLGWPAYVRLVVRVDGGRTFKLRAAAMVDTADVHDHLPLTLAARERRTTRVHLTELAQVPEDDRDLDLEAALVVARHLTVRAALVAPKVMRQSPWIAIDLGLPTLIVPKESRACVTALVASGQNAVCALTRAGTPWCFGEWSPGRDPNSDRDRPGPIVQLERGVAELAMSGALMCARTPAGVVYCGGPGALFERVPDLPPLLGFASHDSLLCGWDAPHSAWCWLPAPARRWPAQLESLSGPCGVDTNHGLSCAYALDYGASSPALPASLPPITAVAAGRTHLFALQPDGTVVAWQADGRAAPELTPLSGLDQVVALTVRTYRACFTRANGELWCLDVPHLTPTRLAIDGTVVEVALGMQAGCARTDDGALWCWRGGAPQRLHVPPITSVVAAGYRTCGLTAKGEVWCADTGNEAKPYRVKLSGACR